MLALVLALLVAGCGGSDDSGSGNGGSGGGGESTASGAGAAIVARAEEFGSEVRGAEAKGSEVALLGYLDARAKGEGAKACSYLTEDLRQVYGRLSKEGCAVFVEKTVARLPAGESAALAESEIESVRLDGDSGYVIYTDGKGSQQAKPVVREGGVWKVSSVLVQSIR